jgi:hypothetical protein
MASKKLIIVVVFRLARIAGMHTYMYTTYPTGPMRESYGPLAIE